MIKVQRVKRDTLLLQKVFDTFALFCVAYSKHLTEVVLGKVHQDSN